MWDGLIQIIVGLLERVSLQWWLMRKQRKVENVTNQVNKLSDNDVAADLVHWTKPADK